MTTFKSFDAVAKNWKRKYVPEKAQIKALKKSGKFLQRMVKKDHGNKSLEANSPLTIAIKGRNSPLVHKGGLRRGVSLVLKPGLALIFPVDQKLARLHEFGKSWKMKDKQRRFLFWKASEVGMARKRNSNSAGGKITIPARPIWRLAIKKHRSGITRIIKTIITKELTN